MKPPNTYGPRPSHWNSEVQQEIQFNIVKQLAEFNKAMQIGFSKIQEQLTTLEQRVDRIDNQVQILTHVSQDVIRKERDLEKIAKIFEKIPIPLREVKLIPDQKTFIENVDREFERIRCQEALNQNKPKSSLEYVPKRMDFGDVEGDEVHFATQRGTRYDTEIYKLQKIIHKNEDAFCHFTFETSHEGKMQQASCFAVFDGHGGRAVSQFCVDYFRNSLLKCLNHLSQNGEDFEIANSLKISFVYLDALFKAQFPDEKRPGCTACAVLIIGGKVFVANAGDSRALLVRGKGAPPIQLSYDFKSEDVYAQRTVIKRGGSFSKEVPFRVENSLAITRAIGDEYLRKQPHGQKVISPRPHIVCMNYAELTQAEYCYLVMSSDGLTDVAHNGTISHVVAEGHREGKTAVQIAADLVVRAVHAGSQDDITVGIIPLY